MDSDSWEFEVIDKHELRKLIPYSLSQLTRLEQQGLFPKRLKLGPSRVGWLISEVYAWIEEKKTERDLAGQSL